MVFSENLDHQNNLLFVVLGMDILGQSTGACVDITVVYYYIHPTASMEQVIIRVMKVLPIELQ